MPARLTVHFPDQPTRSVLLAEPGDYLIGRDPDCRIALDDDRVSRRHASLTAAAGAWRIADLGSKNGTAVDGRAVETAELARRSWLSFGGLVAGFEILSPREVEQQSASDLDRLRTSVELQRRLTPTTALAELLDRILDSALATSDGERAFILLASAAGDLTVAAAAGVEAAELMGDEFSGSVGAIQRALEERCAVVVADASGDTFLGGRPSVITGAIRCLACVPLQALDQLLGVVYLDSRSPGAVFRDLDVEILEALASHAALAIAVASLDNEVRELGGDLPTRVARMTQAGGVTWSGIRASHGRARAPGR